MRIALLSIHSSPLARLGGKEAGGMNVYVRESARELGRRGVAVDIFTRRQERTLPDVVPLGENVRVFHVRAGPPQPYDKNLILNHLTEMVEQIGQEAAKQEQPYHLIHSHYWVSGEVALRLRQQWRVPVVQMFHTLGAMKNRVARSSEEAETLRRVAIERRLLHAVDAVVAATPPDATQMVEHYGAEAGRLHIIPCGVDVRHFFPQSQSAARERLGLPQAQRLLLCIGRMEPLKGMDCLIRALALLHHAAPHWREMLRVLLIGGEPEERPDAWNSEQHRLAALREECGVAAHVAFLGAQPHELLPTWYAAVDVVVVPSHYESFGMVALEAMACGTPVVASRVGGLMYTIEDGRSGVLVPPDDPHTLAHHVQALLSSRASSDVLRAGARQRAEAYGWEQITQELCCLYNELIPREML
jgi:D-inositol-3-phosphate glycosyltransferase